LREKDLLELVEKELAPGEEKFFEAYKELILFEGELPKKYDESAEGNSYKVRVDFFEKICTEMRGLWLKGRKSLEELY
jgi:hypothetical protein